MRDAQEPLAQVAALLLVVVATTAELQSLAVAVGGDIVSATHLIAAGQDPEGFQPRPQDVAKLRDADVVVRVGLDFDLWLNRIERRGATYVDASTDIALLDVRAGGSGPGDGHAHGRGNPHYWLDPANAEIITGNLLETFARLDPRNAKRYEANRLAFLERLDAAIPEWTRLLANAPPLMAYHDTWPYFARRFRLRFAGVIETRPGVTASPAHLASLVQTAQRERVVAIVRERHEPQRDVEFIASRSGARIAVLASSGPDYFSLIDNNVRTLAATISSPRTPQSR